jgi:hypothetical protein
MTRFFDLVGSLLRPRAGKATGANAGMDDEEYEDDEYDEDDDFDLCDWCNSPRLIGCLCANENKYK